MDKVWRMGKAIIGTKSGVRKSWTIRRVAGHWDAEGLGSVRGQPWKWDPGEDDPPKDLQIRWLTDEERGKVTEEMQDGKVCRLRLRREDFLNHEFTESCQGCKALLAGSWREVTENSAGPEWIRKLKRTPMARQERRRRRRRRTFHLEKDFEEEVREGGS